MGFKPGQSGNPAGRRPGTSQAAKLRKAIEGDIPAIIETLTKAAKAGDVAAARLLLDKALPNLKPVAVTEPVPDLSGGTLSEQGAAVLAGVAAGNVAPEQAQALLAGLAALGKIIETDEITRRIEALEGKTDD